MKYLLALCCVLLSGSAMSATKLTHAKLYFYWAGDKGVHGHGFGCDDSRTSVLVPLKDPTAPMASVYRQLLAIKTEFFHGTTHSNALRNCTLKFSSATVANGTAKIKLTGKLSLGGECDDPRVEMQLTEPARQFPQVKHVHVYINGVPLDKLLGGEK